MEPQAVPSGTKFYFGAPAEPMPPAEAAAIASAVAKVAGISEAHLPQCFIEEDTAARQVLVVGVPDRADISAVAQQLDLSLPAGLVIDILPFHVSAFPKGVREAKCQIYPLR